MIRKIFERLTGIDKIRSAAIEDAKEAIAAAKEAKAIAIEAETAAEFAIQKEITANLTPKERATALGQPWVSVVDTKVNFENPRNGFFELDWNDQFILQLKQTGYGFDGDLDEQIVDRWFRELALTMLENEDEEPIVHAGSVKVALTPDRES